MKAERMQHSPTWSCNPGVFADCLAAGNCSGACTTHANPILKSSPQRAGFLRPNSITPPTEYPPQVIDGSDLVQFKRDPAQLLPTPPERDLYQLPTYSISSNSPPAEQSSPNDNDPTFALPSAPKRAKTSANNSGNQPKRLPHSIIERRYRDNLNKQLDSLRAKIPRFKDSLVCSQEIEDSGIPAKWPSKAVIVASGVRYIEQLEHEQKQAESRVQLLERQQAETNTRMRALQDQVEALQKLVRCDDCSILKYLESLQVSNGDGNNPMPT